MKKTICTLLLATLCTAVAAQHPFDVEIARLNQDVAAGRLTRLEADREMLRGVRAYFPNDLVSASYFESMVEYGELLEAKKITKIRYDQLVKMRMERFEETQRQRAAENQAYQQSQQEEYERQQRVMRNAAILQGIGNAFRMGR